MDHWADFWTDRLSELFPVDLATKPVYIMARSEVPSIVGSDSHLAAAFNGTLLDLEMRPTLEAQGRWQGNGHGIVICNHQWLTGSMEKAITLLVHELAHAIEGEALNVIRWQVDFAPELGKMFVDAMGARKSFKELLPEFNGKPSYFQHEKDFIRCAAHLYERANRRHKYLFKMFAGEIYGLSEPEAYADRLGDELKQQDIPVAEILRTPCPEGFLELWESDVRSSATTEGN